MYFFFLNCNGILMKKRKTWYVYKSNKKIENVISSRVWKFHVNLVLICLLSTMCEFYILSFFLFGSISLTLRAHTPNIQEIYQVLYSVPCKECYRQYIGKTTTLENKRKWEKCFRYELIWREHFTTDKT